MGGEVVVKRLYDYELVMGTMNDMWDDISEDGVDVYTPDLLGEIWLGCFVDSAYVGMFRFHNKTSQCLGCHVFMLKEYRANSFECGIAAKEWIFENTEAKKLMVNIPEIFPNVIDYVVNLGFKQEGYSENMYLKNGNVCGMFYYGLHRGLDYA